jgi:hypothetical protein
VYLSEISRQSHKNSIAVQIRTPKSKGFSEYRGFWGYGDSTNTHSFILNRGAHRKLILGILGMISF